MRIFKRKHKKKWIYEIAPNQQTFAEFAPEEKRNSRYFAFYGFVRYCLETGERQAVCLCGWCATAYEWFINHNGELVYDNKTFCLYAGLLEHLEIKRALIKAEQDERNARINSLKESWAEVDTAMSELNK